MATATLSSTTAVWGYPVLLGMGFGWSLTYLIAAAQLSAPPELIAITSGVLLSARSLGGSIGLAMCMSQSNHCKRGESADNILDTAIFNSSLSAKIAHNIPAAVLPLGLPPQSLGPFIGALAANDQEAIAHIPGVNPAIIGAGVHALQVSYLRSFHGVWTAAAVISGVTALGEFHMLLRTVHADANSSSIMLLHKSRP
jgi:hypothetical protein